MSKKLKKGTVATNADNAPVLSRPSLVLILQISLLVFVGIYLANFLFPASAHAQEITVYKSPNCGCCNKWVSHLEKNGFKVNAHNRNDMASIKQQLGIAPQQQSCHTAIVEGYIIEGHVPAADVKRLLREKPDVQGLTVPGMPMGSPGMEGPRKDAYSVLAIDRQGETTVYSPY